MFTRDRNVLSVTDGRVESAPVAPRGSIPEDPFAAGEPHVLATVACDTVEYGRRQDVKDRRLYLYGHIESVDNDIFETSSTVALMVEQIMAFNRADRGIPPEEREPVRLYINSPGGELFEGFSLVSAIELSKTPIYTINTGEWCSMAFLIGIAGHKRFSLPNSIFLMHDGSSGAFGSAGKVQDQVDFEKRYEKEVVREHVLKHSNMKGVDYDALARAELYMLPSDALERDFIDEIVTDIDTIL